MTEVVEDELRASDEPRAPRRLGFVPALDGVRGISVLLVVAYHLQIFDRNPFHNWNSLKGGFLGVEIFFVLSAFLITSLLLGEQAATGRVRFRSFYRRRALRLLPVLFLIVVASAVYAIVAHVPAGSERSSLLAVIFYYANWKIVFAHSAPRINGGLGHLWSLSVEEQFYMVWPLLTVLLLSLRRRAATVAALVSAGILVVIVARVILLRHTPTTVLYLRTDMQADTLLVGALAAQLWVRGMIPRRPLVPLAYVSLVFLAVCVVRVRVESHFLYKGGYTLVALAVAVILVTIVDTSWSVKRVLMMPALRAVGRVSYGIYVYHFFIFYVVLGHSRHWTPSERIIVSLAITAIVTVLSWFLVERRFLRRKGRAKTPSAST